jgi:outer membrane beta-barrel protein
MTKLSQTFVSLSALLVTLLVVLGGTAAAQKRLNGLDDDEPVRHRRLLVKHRFEVTPLFESSIDAAYMHTVGGGLKLEYHLSDMFSIGVIGVASTSIHTSLTDNILATLPDQPMAGSKVPGQQQFLDHINTMPFHGAAYLSWTPWYGKLAAFGAAYLAFDFYFQAGLAFAQLSSNCPTTAGLCDDTHPGTSVTNPDGTVTPPDDNPRNDPPLNSGTRVGLYLGGGIHVFLSDFIALDLTVRDYAFSDNPSGADVNADEYVGNDPKLGDDNRFLQHIFFGVGLSIMFPTTVKRTP